jgi:hypothetical protein
VVTKEYLLTGSDAVSPGKTILTFLRKVLLPSELTICIMLVVHLADPSALKMESVHSSETSVNFYQTTWRTIP